jgi:hypothetical protein
MTLFLSRYLPFIVDHHMQGTYDAGVIGGKLLRRKRIIYLGRLHARRGY